jgi:ergothioneine biosynthesis protein EgtB
MKVLEHGHEARSITLEHDVSNIKDRYLSIRHYTEEICKPLQIEDFVVQPSSDVSSPNWHLGHTTCFFEEFVLAVYYQGYNRLNERYSLLFRDYYDTADRFLRGNRGNFSRPTVAEIIVYRKYVDDHILEILHELPEDALLILETGLNHEQQHQEFLFSDLKFILGNNPLLPVYKESFSETLYRETDISFAFIPEGEYSIGYVGYGFSYENEQAVHQVMLKSFQIRKSLVTNGEYLQFMQCGGYQRPEYWLNDGWEWVKANNVEAPMYWYDMGGAWHRYALCGAEMVDLSEPVTHINFYEASAFAQWRGWRLPTEFEWEAASDQFQWGQRWEHCNSAYLPYPGYVKPEGVISDNTTKFMINAMVHRGASVVTSPGHSRKTYRNFFHPNLRMQFNGIRLCKE